MNLITLEQSVRRCSLHAQLILISKTLSCNGFGDVQILDRRLTRQKSRFGGHELLCVTQVGTVPVRIVVKVVRDSVRLRMLDELAGVVIRMEADLGLIVSPYRLIGRALINRPRYRPARVEVIDGRMLVRMMVKHRIGLTLEGQVDLPFFEHLNYQSRRVLNLLTKVKE